MKKFLSLFLAMVMTLSVFSCLGVVAGAATTDLVIDTEYTVTSGETKIFVPEESGYYKFESNGYGDPRITLYCYGEEIACFDDENDMDFSGVVHLEAGFEVSCVLYNYDEEDCVFTITEAVGVDSISVSLTEEIEIMENTNGEMIGDYYYDDEADEEVLVEYFRYDTPSQLRNEGNTITLYYSDDTSVVYTCDDCGDYVNEDGAELDFTYSINQSYNNQWVIDGENFITIWVEPYYDAQAQIPVTIVENPYESIEFTLAEPLEIMENTRGEMTEGSYWDEETDDEIAGEYFYYDAHSELYKEGNTITVNYKDGSSVVYTYDGYWDFVDEDGNDISFYTTTNQNYENQWVVGSTYYITVVVDEVGKSVQVPVTIVENPYESIEFAFAESVEYIENVDGYWCDTEIWNEETEEWEDAEYFRYYAPYMFDEGNTITINLKDGTSVVYTCDDSGDYVNDDGDILIYWDDWSYNINQGYYNQWSLGSDNYITVSCLGFEAQVPVTIVENPYESIEFIPVESLTVQEYTNGCWESYYDEDAGEYVSAYFYYIGDLITQKGNIIKLTLTDGTTKTYVCDEYDSFYNSDGEWLELDYGYDAGSFSVGSDNLITVSAFGVSCEFNFTITENSSVVVDNTFMAEKLSDTTCMITEIAVDDDFDGVLDIPAEINGLTVVGIEDGTLSDAWGLEVLNLPAGFDMISENLFNYCWYLSEINVDEENERFASVNGVLYNKSLTEILFVPEAFAGDLVIKAGVTELSANALAGMSNAASVEIEEGNTSFALEDGILYNADFTKIYKAFSVDADYVMKDTVTELADYAFSGNEDIEIVTFAAGVTEISYAAFLDCSSLASVALPEGLISIGDHAFNSSGLTSIALPEATKQVGSYAFCDNVDLAEISLNEGLESLGSCAFIYTSVDEITLPDSLTEMGASCFEYCESLSALKIGSGLTSISDYCFYGCDALTGVDIPENVTELGAYSFAWTGLTSIELHNKLTDIPNAFRGTFITEVEVPDSVVNMDGAFAWCESLKSATVGSGVKSMNYAFNGCSALETIELAEGISGSCDFAFSGCSKLGEIDLPSTVTELSYAQFSGCEAIEELDIPETLYKVEAHALDGSGWYANQADGVTYLEHVLFDYKGEMPEDYSLSVKAGTTAIAESAFENAEELVEVALPDGLKYIGAYAFDGCSQLTEITIPGCVEFIGEYALGYNCRYNTVVEGFTIYGIAGSVAEEYADKNGFEFIAVSGHTHTPGDWIIDSAATCTTAGSKHKECTECKEVLETATVTATGHTAVKLPAVAATCTTAGKTEGSRCSVCKTVIKAQTVVPAKGHTAVKLPAVAATCTTAGKTEGSQCSVCKAILKAQTTVAAKGHTSSNWITDKAATAAAAGSMHKECTVCKKVLETKAIAQLNPATPKTATANAVGGVKVSWNKVDGAIKYVVFRRAAGTKTWVNIGTTTELTLLDKNVKSGTYYCYSVRAYNSANGYSAFNQSMTSTRKYMESPKLTTIYNHVNGLAIKWNAVAGVTNGYRVYRRGAGSTYWYYLGTTKNTYWIDSGVKNANGGYYRYTVIADGGYHSAFDTTGLYLKRLANPTLLSATKANSGITVKWSAIKGTTGYYVYRKTANSGWQRIAAVGGTNNTSFVDKSAKSGTTYTYTVRACYGYTLSSYNSGISCKR